VKAAAERHPAKLRQNQKPGCLACHNSTTNNLQIHWRNKGTGAPPPNRHRKQTPEHTPSLLGTPPTSTGNTSGAQLFEIFNLTARYAYSHTSHPCAESFALNISAQDSENDTDYDPDMLPDDGTSTG